MVSFSLGWDFLRAQRVTILDVILRLLQEKKLTLILNQAFSYSFPYINEVLYDNVFEVVSFHV